PVPALSVSLLYSAAPAPPRLPTLSLHDALPISTTTSSSSGALRSPPSTWKAKRRLTAATILCAQACARRCARSSPAAASRSVARSEEHTSELQSRSDLVCRLLLEKKKKHLAVQA